MPKGGKRDGAGRKSKLDELGIHEKFDEFIKDDELIKILIAKAREEDDIKALNLLLSYKWGKPTKEITINGDIDATHSIVDIKNLFKFKE